ncbi:hypothetical protein D5S17_19725 [Pseudonocardiaceae bacterium YIM PH 21723]|nr:hypothetical protein D5S17_19725 [Pseudonocardiaceae bacterium YIM PH 21723]
MQHLEVGQRFMTLFTLVSFVRNEHVTIQVSHWLPRFLLGDLAISYVIRPIESGGTRLIVKLTLPHLRGLGWIYQYCMGWLDFFMMRRQMLNMRDYSEGRRGVIATESPSVPEN